jgi:predicted nucleic acid-binding protein
MEENKKVIVDSSVIISALISSKGPSYYCLISAKDKGYRLFISEFILKEILDVIERKFPNLLIKLFEILTISEITILKNPNKKDLKLFEKLVEKEDTYYLSFSNKRKS